MARFIKIIPLLILSISTLYLLFMVIYTNVALNKWHIVGLVLLSASITAQMINAKSGYWLTGLTLFVSTFSFAAFTPTISTLKIGFIELDLFSLATFLVYIVIHRRDIPNWILAENKAD